MSSGVGVGKSGEMGERHNPPCCPQDRSPAFLGTQGLQDRGARFKVCKLIVNLFLVNGYII